MNPGWQNLLEFPLLTYIKYGNIGYGEFKGGTKNQKVFVPNMTIFQEKINIMKIG